MSPAALPPGAVAVVRTTPDTAYARWTAGLGDPDAGVAAVAARPGLRHSGWLARDLLAALGKRFTVAASGRSADRDWQLVPVWYAAHGITDLIVAGCQQLPAAVVDDLICHTRPLPLRLWLLADNHLPQPLADALAVWPTTPLAQADFTAHWHHHPARHPDADPTQKRTAGRRGWRRGCPPATFPPSAPTVAGCWPTRTSPASMRATAPPSPAASTPWPTPTPPTPPRWPPSPASYSTTAPPPPR